MAIIIWIFHVFLTKCHGIFLGIYTVVFYLLVKLFFLNASPVPFKYRSGKERPGYGNVKNNSVKFKVFHKSWCLVVIYVNALTKHINFYFTKYPAAFLCQGSEIQKKLVIRHIISKKKGVIMKMRNLTGNNLESYIKP